MKDTLIAYYSKSGNVKKMAEDLSKEREADLYEIKDLVKRNGIIGFIKSGYQSRLKKCTPIGPVGIDLTQYKTVVVCGPIWAGNIASPIRTFLRDYADKINQIEYVIMRGAKDNEYTEIFAELDALAGKKNVGTKSICVSAEK